MPKRLQKQIDKLKKMILSLGGEVENSLRRAVQALENRDARLAKEIIEHDHEINNMEVDLEEECLKVLALYQPVAIDLRYIVAVLKINNDLERIGDIAVNIAKRSIFLSARDPVEIPFNTTDMAERVQNMLAKSLNALVQLDPNLARTVLEDDDEIDRINRETHGKFASVIRENPTHIDSYLPLLLVSRHLERIADHATNVAEDVIYLAEGEIVRHNI